MPGPQLRSVLGVTPRTWRKADNTIGIDPVYSLGTQIPFSCTSARVAAGSPVTLRATTGQINPLYVSASTAIKDVRLTASSEVYAPTSPCIGVAINDVELNEMGIAAGPGSIVICTCNDSSVDTNLQTVGNYVVVHDTVAGTVKSATQADVVAGVYDGGIVGRVIFPAGTATGATGSVTAVGVLITLGY